MIQKETWVYITDNTNVRWLKTFHLYKGFHRKSTSIGLFIKGSAKIVEPPRLEYKGFKYKFNIKGDICRLWFIRANSNSITLANKFTKFFDNSGFIIKKKNDPKSKFLNGPVSKSLKKKKLLTLFSKVV